MVLGTMALIFGMGALGLSGLNKDGKNKRLVDTNTKDPKNYVEQLCGVGYMKANPQYTKKQYLRWLDYNFVLSNEEMEYWANEYDKYRKKLENQRKNEAKNRYINAEKEYYKKIQDPNRQKNRQRAIMHHHYFLYDLDYMMCEVLENTFIGNEINKSWIIDDAEEFLCLETKLNKNEIKKYYEICWNYTHNNDIDRF